MTDIRRQVGDIGVTQFINPGVEDKSGAAMLAAVGQGALDIDQKIAENKLQAELDNMRTIYETSSFALTGAEAPGGLTQADVQEISRAKDRLGQMSRAVEQGRMSIDMYRVTAEAALRAAIARRPGLAAEFRQLASDTLGTDVAGAGIQVLAQAEAAMVQDAKAALRSQAEAESAALKNSAETYRKMVESTPALSRRPEFINMSDEQIVGYFTNAEDTQAQADLAAGLRTREAAARAEQAKIANERMTGELGANRLFAQTTFQEITGRYDAAIANFNSDIQRLGADGWQEEDMVEVRQIITTAMGTIRGMERDVTSSEATLGASFVKSQLDLVNNDRRMFETLLNAPVQDVERIVASMKGYAHMRALGDPQVMTLSLVSDSISPQVAAEIAAQSPEVRNRVLTVAAASINEGQGSKTLMNNASAAMGDYAKMLTDAGTRPIAEGTLALAQRDTNKILQAFTTAPTRDYNMQEFSGPTGLTYFLSQQTGKAFAARMTEAQRKEVGDNIVAASNRHLAIARSKFLTENPALRDKVRFALMPDGSFIQGTGLSATEQQAVRDAERRYINGKQILGAASTFGIEQPATVISTYRAPATPPTPTAAPAAARATSTPAPQGGIRSVADELNSIYGGG